MQLFHLYPVLMKTSYVDIELLQIICISRVNTSPCNVCYRPSMKSVKMYYLITILHEIRTILIHNMKMCRDRNWVNTYNGKCNTEIKTFMYVSHHKLFGGSTVSDLRY
jgi:hypothetical protein